MSAERKRVLLIAPQPFFESRGTPLNVRAMAETLGASGLYEVDLLVFPFGADIELPGVRVQRCNRLPGISRVPVGPSFQKLFLDLSLFRRARSLHRSRNYDLIHGVEEGAFIADWILRGTSIPYICDMDSCMETQLRDSSIVGTTAAAHLFARLEAAALKRCAAVLTVCTALTEKVQELVPEKFVMQIEDFPAAGSERGSSVTVSRLRQEFSLTSEQRYLLYTGNFERYQGIELLLQAFAVFLRLQESGKFARMSGMVKLILVGGGGEGQTLFETMRAKARELGISAHVLFCGNRPQQEMGSFMSIADVLVSPRIEGENTPLKLYSYMAAGKPIVATNIYSHTQVLDESLAYLADVEVEPFAAALAEALAEDAVAVQRRNERALAARRLVEQRYSRASFDRRLLQLYDHVFSERELGVQAGTQLPVYKAVS